MRGAEVCGLILDNGSLCELVQVRNKVKRGGGFAFYFGEVRGIEKWAGLCNHKIVGTFHSHPLGLPEPGPSDLSNALEGDMMFIFDVLGRSARLWHIKNRKAKELRFRLL
jgi:proteasome lid subunit RPN8/RPN11